MPEKKEEKVQNPIIVYTVQCPVCQYSEVKSFALKAKTLPINHNVIHVPYYEENAKYSYVDFNEVQFAVCPYCYFTGSNKQDFDFEDPSTNISRKSTTDPKIIKHWEANTDKIMSSHKTPGLEPEHFHYPRTNDAILLSYRLALYKATLELELKVPFAYIKRANRYLRYYTMQAKLKGIMDDEILKLAVADLEKVFYYSDFPEKKFEFEVCYQLVACNIRLGDEEKAATYIKVLDKTRGEMVALSKTIPTTPVNDATKWNNAAKELWASRTDPTIWKVVPPSPASAS